MTPDKAENNVAKSSQSSGIAQIAQKYQLLLATILLALIACAATAQSATKLFWWDELASYDIAQLPHAADVWNFFKAGLDTPSPVPTLIVQATLQHIGKSEVLARLPFEAGYLLMCLCLYGFVARRYGAGYALAASLMPALCGAFYYASELRTYGIVLGAISFALYCWQNADKAGALRWLGILGVFVGLTVAIACHIFAIFVLIPFAFGQFIRDRHAHRIDFPAWTTLVLAPLSLVPQLSGMSAAHHRYAGLFWSKPSGGQILFSYSYSVTIGWTVAVVVVLMVCSSLARKFESFSEPSQDRGFDSAEWTLIASLTLLPLIAWPLSHLVGVYVPRYVLPLLIGLTLVVVGGAAETMKRNRLAGLVLTLAFWVVFVQDKRGLVTSAFHHHPSPTASFRQQSWVQALDDSSLPVVAPNTPVYAQMQHYVSPTMEQRLYYTPHAPGSIRPQEDLDAELSMQLFSARLPLRVEEFSAFAAEHRKFLVVVKGSLAQSGKIGNLSIQWLGSYAAGEQFGFAEFSIYEVDVADPRP